MTPLRTATLEHADGRGVTLALAHGWRCRVALVAPGIGRQLMLPPGGLREPRTWAIVDPAATDESLEAAETARWNGRDRQALFANAPEVRCVQTADHVELSDERLRVRITLNPFGLAWDQWDGDVWQRCCADRATFAYGSDGRTGLTGHWQQRDANDQYFGLGDKTGPLNHAGKRLRTRQLDALGYNGETSDPLYKHWPFFLGRRADTGAVHGIYYDTLAECHFDFGREHDNYHGLYRATEVDDGDLDVYVFAGPDLPTALSRFVALIGGTAFPPRWTLGYANTAMGLADAPDAQAQIAGFLATAQALDFPLSAFHFGSGYTSRGPRRYVYTWNRDKFPEPAALLQAFRDAGVRTVANLKPCLLDDHPAFAAVAGQGGFVRNGQGDVCLDAFWDGRGAHLDFSRPVDRAWWQDGLQREVLGTGFDAGWNDNNEYPVWDEGAVTSGPDGLVQPIHRSRPLHALLMAQATADQQRRHAPQERVYTITRAGFPGIQREAQTWTGDNTTGWHTLRWNQRMAQTMSLSGLFNIGHDIGGFAGPVPDAELLIRWTQACCLLPRMIMNSWKADGSVNSPWLHPEATEAIRAAVQLRLRLMPTLYTLMWEAHREHRPVVRPTCYHFADDPHAWEDNDEMMIGPDLLVAPVFEPGARTRDLYLPRGRHANGWFDWRTGRQWPGGQTVTVDAPLDELPLFVREGAMLVTTDRTQTSHLTEEASRAVRWYPTPAGSARPDHGSAYEDDGVSPVLGRDQACVMELEGRATADALTLRVVLDGTGKRPSDHLRVVLPASEARPLSWDAPTDLTVHR